MDILCETCYNNLKRSSSVKYSNENYYIWNYEAEFKKLMSSYKFKNLKNNSKILAKLLDEKIKFVIEKENIDLVIPVPIHKKRESKRGFNQVEEVLKDLKIDFYNIKRKKATKAMFKLLTEEKRDKNIKDSFEIEKNLSLDGLNILIVDDIITTGATLKEMEKEIKKESEVDKVVFFTFAAARYSRMKK